MPIGKPINNVPLLSSLHFSVEERANGFDGMFSEAISVRCASFYRKLAEIEFELLYARLGSGG